MVGQVGPAVDAAVGAVAVGQVGLEGLGARHPDHGRGRGTVQEGAASPGRLAGEAPQHAGEGRGGGRGGRHTPGGGDVGIQGQEGSWYNHRVTISGVFSYTVKWTMCCSASDCFVLCHTWG